MTTNAVAAAREGKRVIVVAPRHDDARHAFEVIASQHPELRSTRSAGREAIETPEGGRITFESARAHGVLRGAWADVVLVTDPGTLTDHDVVRAAVACTHTSRRAEVGLLIELADLASTR